jgi:hypothetical protein
MQFSYGISASSAESYLDSDASTNTSNRLNSHRPLILVCGARPEERAALLRTFPAWEFKFVPYENLGGIYTEMSLRPEASMLLMAKRYIEGPEMLSFFCQSGMPYYLFENKGDLCRANWTKCAMGMTGA